MTTTRHGMDNTPPPLQLRHSGALPQRLSPERGRHPPKEDHHAVKQAPRSMKNAENWKTAGGHRGGTQHIRAAAQPMRCTQDVGGYEGVSASRHQGTTRQGTAQSSLAADGHKHHMSNLPKQSGRSRPDDRLGRLTAASASGAWAGVASSGTTSSANGLSTLAAVGHSAKSSSSSSCSSSSSSTIAPSTEAPDTGQRPPKKSGTTSGPPATCFMTYGQAVIGCCRLFPEQSCASAIDLGRRDLTMEIMRFAKAAPGRPMMVHAPTERG
mmetsp:Transcript_100500/g.313221  ORF Transcript_100500/g.313221 Transcript_100500/m.313221 type:complete len:268 (+) Transcript_100500:173-976(+)